jgi:hypothetical protein
MGTTVRRYFQPVFDSIGQTRRFDLPPMTSVYLDKQIFAACGGISPMAQKQTFSVFVNSAKVTITPREHYPGISQPRP